MEKPAENCTDHMHPCLGFGWGTGDSARNGGREESKPPFKLPC
jgi:hypothetical protein